ncbi:MAG TPA: hypothetical protein VLE51_03175 [Candidatus Saccharimonadales bacterium]|nr:hypothetical protein [Candidatus Saccharimonadales bacterium]
MAIKSFEDSSNQFTRIEDLADPVRLALIAVSKARYARPIYYGHPAIKEVQVYDLEAAMVDAMLDSSISPLHSMKLKPDIERIALESFPNHDKVMERRRQAVKRINEDTSGKLTS